MPLDAIRDLDAFRAISFKDESRYRADYENCVWSLLAFKILKDEDRVNSVTKILNFLELFPELHKIREEKRYAIDWKNMSYKLYNYGPNGNEIKLEKMGAFSGVDKRRRAFMKALWAQVLIPLQPNEYLESQIVQYFVDGTFDFNRDSGSDELTALFQDLILVPLT